MECEECECRCRNVDANNVIRVLPRKVAQAEMVPTTLALRSWVGDVGKELPRDEPVNVCPLGRTSPKHDWKPSQHAYVPGIPQGQPLYE